MSNTHKKELFNNVENSTGFNYIKLPGTEYVTKKNIVIIGTT